MNAFALFSMLLGGAVLGMLPFAAFLDSPLYLGAYTFSCAILAFVTVVRQRSLLRQSTDPNRFIHGFLGAAAYAGSGAYMGFFLYGTGWTITRGIGIAAGWLELAWEVNPPLVGAWLSVPFSVLYGVLGVSFNQIPSTVYPEVAGTASAYEDLNAKRTLRWQIPLLLSGALVVFAAYVLNPAGWWWYVLAAFMILGSGISSMQAATNWSPRVAIEKIATRAVQKLYASLGYEVLLSPRTKDASADVDALMKEFELLASNDDHVLAVAIEASSKPGQAAAAADSSILPVASRALHHFFSKDSEEPVRVDPVLVLVDREPTVDLALFAKQEGLKVVALTFADARDILRQDDDESLRRLAREILFSDSAGISALEASDPEASAPT